MQFARQAEQMWSAKASPERGGWLGGGPFVGEGVGGDSLSLAASSPTCTDTHRRTVRDSEGSDVQELDFMRQVNTV